MWPHPLGSASSAKWGQVSPATGLWGASQMLQCVCSAMPRFFSFCCSSNAFQLSISESKVIGGGISEIRNEMEVPDYMQELLIFLFISPAFFLQSSACLFPPFHLFLRIEWRKEKMLRQWRFGLVRNGRVPMRPDHQEFPGIWIVTLSHEDLNIESEAETPPEEMTALVLGGAVVVVNSTEGHRHFPISFTHPISIHYVLPMDFQAPLEVTFYPFSWGFSPPIWENTEWSSESFIFERSSISMTWSTLLISTKKFPSKSKSLY